MSQCMCYICYMYVPFTCLFHMYVPFTCAACAYMRGPLVFQSGESLEAEAMSGKKVVVSTVGPSPAQVRALQRLQRALHQIECFKLSNSVGQIEGLLLYFRRV